MPAKLWTGTISFGLVAIPVSLVPASRAVRSVLSPASRRGLRALCAANALHC